jgi:hypothetical protein
LRRGGNPAPTQIGAHHESEELGLVPQRKRSSHRLVLAIAALVLAGIALLRSKPDPVAVLRPPMLEPVPDSAPPPVPRPRPAASRIALAATFTVLFFGGAAFTAGAGDRVALLIEDPGVVPEQVETTEFASSSDEPAPEAAPVPEALPADAAEVAPASELAPAPAPEAEAALAPEAAPAPDAAPAPVADEPEVAPTEYEPAAAAPAEPISAPAAPAQPKPAAAKPAPKAATAAAKQPAVRNRKWVTVRAQLPPARPAEIEHQHGGAPTIWLNRALPDPTPASARLARPFARSLVRAARAHGSDWATVLGALRAQGHRGAAPATRPELDRLAGRLQGDAWRGTLALSGRTSYADRATALADYYRAVGIESLVTGLEKAKARLVKRLLKDERVTLYAGGREDLEAGRIDVRIVVLLSYLAERHGSLTVSSLFSGHRRFARPGVVSAHVYGHAVDIAVVGGTSIVSDQQPGGMTEAAVRSILLLPAELQPQQVISLLGLGGPSFPLADHEDHIHVGF